MYTEPIVDAFGSRRFDTRSHVNVCTKPGGSSDHLIQSPSGCLQGLSEPLPEELWEPVFGIVSPGALLAFRAACLAFRKRLDDPNCEPLWRAAYLSEWRDNTSGRRACEQAVELWRHRFLARWWAHELWSTRLPTVSTLMGRKAHGGTVTCLALGECGVDADEGFAVSASDDSSLFLWRFACNGSRKRSGSPGVAQQHHRQSHYDFRCPQRSKQFHGHAGPVWCLWFNPEQDRVLSGGYDATIKSWSLSNERCEASLRGHGGWVRSLDVMRSGSIVVSGCSDGTLKIWNLESLQCLHTTQSPHNDARHSVECLTAIDEQRTFISCHSGLRHLLRWDIETSQHTESFEGHEADVYAVHADGPSALLVSGSKDRTIKVWDTRTQSSSSIQTLRAHSAAVLDLKLRGNRIVSASRDKTVRMWDIRLPSVPLATFEGHSAEVYCVDFRDRMVLSGSRDTSLKIWTVV